MTGDTPILRETRQITQETKAGILVKYDGGIAGDNDANVAGPLYQPVAANELGTVTMIGIATLVASAAIAEGAKLSAAANGQAKTRTASNPVIGRALAAAGAAGDEFPALIFPSS